MIINKLNFGIYACLLYIYNREIKSVNDSGIFGLEKRDIPLILVNYEKCNNNLSAK